MTEVFNDLSFTDPVGAINFMDTVWCIIPKRLIIEYFFYMANIIQANQGKTTTIHHGCNRMVSCPEIKAGLSSCIPVHTGIPLVHYVSPRSGLYALF